MAAGSMQHTTMVAIIAVIFIIIADDNKVSSTGIEVMLKYLLDRLPRISGVFLEKDRILPPKNSEHFEKERDDDGDRKS